MSEGSAERVDVSNTMRVLRAHAQRLRNPIDIESDTHYREMYWPKFSALLHVSSKSTKSLTSTCPPPSLQPQIHLLLDLIQLAFWQLQHDWEHEPKTRVPFSEFGRH